MSILEYMTIRFSFSERPGTIPPDLRPVWRIAVLLLILNSSRGKHASLKRLHVLNWAIRTPESRKQFATRMDPQAPQHGATIRFEPGLGRALVLAEAEGLIQITRGATAQLTNRGRQIADEIEACDACLSEERQFMHEVGIHILEKDIDPLLTMESKP